MAQAIPCDFCGQRAAVLLIGNLDNGQQIAVCGADVPQACDQLRTIYAAAATPADVSAPDAPATASEDNGAGAQPAPRSSGSEGEAQPSAGPDGAGETQASEPAAADAS